MPFPFPPISLRPPALEDRQAGHCITTGHLHGIEVIGVQDTYRYPATVPVPVGIHSNKFSHSIPSARA